MQSRLLDRLLQSSSAEVPPIPEPVDPAPPTPEPVDPAPQLVPLPPPPLALDVVEDMIRSGRWGPFRFTARAAATPRGGPYGAFEVGCRFHAKSKIPATGCAKSVRIRGDQWADRWVAAREAVFWASNFRLFDRQRDHVMKFLICSCLHLFRKYVLNRQRNTMKIARTHTYAHVRMHTHAHAGTHAHTQANTRPANNAEWEYGGSETFISSNQRLHRGRRKWYPQH